MELNMANVTRLVPARSSEVLTECQRLASERLPGSLKTVLDKVDDALFELANKADNSQRQNLYFDAMRELRLKRDSFETSFVASFNEEFENSIDIDKAAAKEAQFAHELELSLVDTEEVEESLAMTNFVESMRTKCKEQLFHLDRRMGFLLSQPDLADTDNPVGPHVIGTAFKTACQQLDSDIEVKLTLFKMFDKFAGNGIHQMYNDLNDHLIRRDVLPKISASVTNSAGSGRRTRVIIESEDEQIEATGPDVYSTLQSMMSNGQLGANGSLAQAISSYAGGVPGGGMAGGVPGGGMVGGVPGGGMAGGVAGGGIAGGVPGGGMVGGVPGGGMAGGVPGGGMAGGVPGGGMAGGIPGGEGGGGFAAGGGTAAFATENLVDTLTLLQQGDLSGLQGEGAGLPIDPTQISAGNVNVLRAIRETGAIGQVNQNDGLTLDIVSILFDYILDDPAIPDGMKALIGRLQIPMLKVALLDKALFSKKTHPARRLLDALAAAAIGWSDSPGDDDSLYNVVERIVRTIVDEFENDVTMFEHALEDLEAFLARETNEAEKRAADSARSLRVREQIELAKMAVDDAINDRIKDHEMRAFVRQFLLDYWRQLMIITHIEHGIESEIWHDQLQTAEDLVWSIQPKTTPEERKSMTQKLSALLKNIKRGMATLEMEPRTCSKFLSMLASVHVVSVKNTEEAGLAEKHLFSDQAEDEPLVAESDTADSEDFVKQGLARLFEQKGVESEELDLDLSAFEEDPEATPEPEHLSPEIMAFVEEATQLDLGDWVEFDNDDGSTMRARFTWISPSTGRYLFTTRQGEKALDTTLTGLADQLARGVARRVATQPDPIFDRAIGDLMNKLDAEAATA